MEGKDKVKIIKGLQQAAYNGSDMSSGDNMSQEDIPLKREKGNKIVDTRVMDGFNVRIAGKYLTLTYQSEETIDHVHENGYEDDVRRTLRDLVQYLQKEYKNLSGESVTLTQVEEPHIQVQNTSSKRVWVQATAHYEVSTLEEFEKEGPARTQDELDELDKMIDNAKSSAKDMLYRENRPGDNDETGDGSNE